MPAPRRQPLQTRWAEDVDPSNPLPEYPRPQLRRERWQSLNGRWQLAICDGDGGRPESFPDEIVVPFPVESVLSGIERAVRPSERVWYRRRFEAPARVDGERLLLHFGAVDWETIVLVDGREVGSHRGGHVPFSFDVTDALASGGDDHELVVAVHDPTDAGLQPVGKQSLEPAFIQYTAVTGIWQTVWLEPVPGTRIEGVYVVTEDDLEGVAVRVQTEGARPGDRVELVAIADGREVASGRAGLDPAFVEIGLRIPGARRWSPDDPFLHDLRVRITRDGQTVDEATSYFGVRTVGTGRDAEGVWRILLNGEPIFHLGLLDQGWWPDGLYTAPTDEALAFDVEATKRMGFNTIRKHVKVEPARWYWHADRTGVLVWQDMPSPRFDQKAFFEAVTEAGGIPEAFHLTVADETAAAHREELGAMIDALEPFACIQVWVPFNEAWGQHDTDAVLARVAERDPTRVVDGPSGWQDTGSGGLRDHHDYDEEIEFSGAEPDRPVVYGEIGGLKLAVPGHMAVDRGWGYQQFASADDLEKRYAELMALFASFVPRGLAAAIYTQTTDVESELNGLLTYDRAVFKIEPAKLSALHALFWS